MRGLLRFWSLTGGNLGLQTLVLTLTDLVTGDSSTVRRRVKVR
jgi:hypothetical protein